MNISHRLATDIRLHPLQTDRETDRRRTTTMPIARPLLKYGWLKIKLIRPIKEIQTKIATRSCPPM